MDLRALLAPYPFLGEAQLVTLTEALTRGELTEAMLEEFLKDCARTKAQVEAHMRTELELFDSLHKRLQQLTDTTQRETIQFAESVSNTSDALAEERILSSLDS